MDWILKLIGYVSRPRGHEIPKNPMDWSLTSTSTKWSYESFCAFCKTTSSHEEFMSDMCDDCGCHGNMMSKRSFRKIWNGKEWVLQRKYGNGASDYTITKIGG